MGRPREVPTVDDLPQELGRLSGVYVIESHQTGRVLYVGESHTNQLRKTIMRHFQQWKQDYMHKQPRATYDRRRVSVRVEVTAPGAAIERQNDLICELEPRDNLLTPGRCDPF